jgi:DNA-binding MarR family transcriptional regulator
MTVDQCLSLFDSTYIISSRDRQELNTSTVQAVVRKMYEGGFVKIIKDSKTIDALYLELTTKGIKKYKLLKKRLHSK